MEKLQLSPNGLPSIFSDVSIWSLVARTISTLVFLYYGSFVYCFVRNCITSRTTGIPSVFIPWDQNAILWVITSVPLRKPIKKYLPRWISNRLSTMTYNWEYLDRMRPWRELEARGKPSHTMQFITCGRFEVWTRDREIASEVLRRTDDFLVFEFTRIFMDKFGVNVLTADNPVWKRHRKVVATVLNEKISASVFQESVKQTDGMLGELFGPKSAPGDVATSARVFDMMKKITIHVLSGAGMGDSPEWNNELAEKPKEGYKMTYIDAVKVVVDCMAGPMGLPVWALNHWPAFAPGAGLMRKLGLAIGEFSHHMDEMLEAKKNEAKVPSGQKGDILTQLVAASSEGENGHASASSQKFALSTKEMAGNLFVFTAAGFDTTANTLSFALVYLARYPQWQDWLMEEVDALVPAGKESSAWEYTDVIPNAKRTLAFMHETVRHQPPVVHEIKTVRTPQTITVSHGSYKIPANTSFYINNVAVHFASDVWRDLNQPTAHSGAPEAEDSAWIAEDGPGDEFRFRPNRWLDPNSGAFFQPPRGSFLPWSMGPRVCPGQKMAQVEFTTIFLRILASCRVEAEALDIQEGGSSRKETRKEINARLDNHIRSATALLALQMDGVYNIDESKGEGLKLRLTRRLRN